ncbi:unnamed protein product [Auanema sp. JU1783]|nr:unnamed protein product [Auanema sp. JU1783]
MFSLLCKFIILAVLFCPITASSKLLIVGQNRNNNYKFALAQRYYPEVDKIVRDSRASFYVFTQNTCQQQNEMVDDVYTQCHQMKLPTGNNFTTIVVSQRGTDEMNFSEIEIFYNFLDKQNPLLVIEIGDEAIQTTALLKKGSKCWGETSTPIISPNRAFLCNDFQPAMARNLIDAQDVQLIPQTTFPKPEVEEKAFWPCIFVSASPKSKKSKETPKIHVQIHDEEEEEVKEVEEKAKKSTNYRPHKAPKKEEEKKLECKYRKSCYETGTVPDIDLSFNFWPSSFTWNTDSTDENDENDDDDDDDDDAENVNRITAMKLKCKYRLDCYKAKKIPLSLKEQEHNEKKAAASIEHSIPKAGKKKSLKDIAEKAVKKVKEAEEKAASRPLPKAVKIEKELDKIEDEMNKKLRCKYRKSCYESGELPEIVMSTWLFSTTSQASDDDDDVAARGGRGGGVIVDAKTYAEMDELDQKVYCKYRKSCYDTGVKPEIEPEIQLRSFKDLKDLPDIVETRKLTIQEKCKYRKSCYATGILPEIHPPVEYVVEQKHISSVVPTSVQDLKHLCKYRKSCYEEIANSGTTDVVKHIRKRRLIEREEKKRRHRRDRLRKRAKGGIEFEEELRHAAEASEEDDDDDDDASQHSKKIRREKNYKPISSEEVDEQPSVSAHIQPTVAQHEDADRDEEEVKKPKKSSKKIKQEVKEEKKPQIEDDDDEPEVPKVVVVEEDEAEVVDKMPKKSMKKQKAVKKQVQKEEEKEAAMPIPVAVVKELPKKAVAEEKIKKSVKDSKKQAKEVKADKKLKKEAEAKAKDNANDDDDDDDDDEYKKKQKQKEFCKYRKSCYETGERPDIDQSISTMYSSFNQHVDKVYDNQKPKSESDQKLDCKYRKSCYDTGRLPDLNIRQQIVVPKLEEIHDKKLHCKYRKSCYDDSIEDEAEKLPNHSEKVPKPSIQKVVTEQKIKKTTTAEKKSEDERKKSSHHAQKEDNDDDNDDDDDDDDDDNDKNDKQKKKVAHIDAHIISLSLEVDEKLDCKYRKSCYANVKPRSKNEDHSGSMARQNGSPIRTKCNEYYLSCREQLGLPPKEKAPIGPNGRRLCRKKKE